MRRLRRQLLTQCRIVEWQAVDGDRDVALVVTVAFQHGLEAIEVAASPADEAEGADGPVLAQSDEVGSRLERGIHFAIARRSEVYLVRLRIGRRMRRALPCSMQGPQA